MAWRIHDSVIRGEIDNRERGRVVGRIWLEGSDEPVVLDLKGNAHPDMAGCLLKFTNPGEACRMRTDSSLHPVQRGTVGDITASRKVRVFDIPVNEALQMIRDGGQPPEHMANALYVEWFSEFNGRVVIESADYALEVSAPEWRMTEEENVRRAEEAAQGMNDFMNQLNTAVEQAQEQVDHDKENWDEFDYEKFMRESDARTDKYMELLDKYGDDEEGRNKVHQEMGWGASDKIEKNPPEELEVPEEIPELKPVPETEGKDWIRTRDGDVAHPLQNRCYEDAMRLWNECSELDLDADDSVSGFITGYQILSAKLAGALNSLAYGCEDDERAFVVANLKRSLGVLHQTQQELETDEVRSRLPGAIFKRARLELFELREAILKLMDEFRGRG